MSDIRDSRPAPREVAEMVVTEWVNANPEKDTGGATAGIWRGGYLFNWAWDGDGTPTLYVMCMKTNRHQAAPRKWVQKVLLEAATLLARKTCRHVFASSKRKK